MKARNLVRFIKRLLAAPFVLIAAILILLEDWFWDDLARVAAIIGQLPVLRAIESVIAGLPSYLALAVFAVPSLLLIPVKLMAVYFIAHGQETLGLLTILGAKILGTALVARIFVLTRPKLLQIRWFAWLHDRVVTFKARVYGYIRSTSVYQAVHEQRLRMIATIKSWLGGRRSVWLRRWSAAIKLSRRRKTSLT